MTPTKPAVTTRAATLDDMDLMQRIHHASYREVVTRQFGNWDDADQRVRFAKSVVLEHSRIVELDGVPVGSMATSEAADHVFLVGIQILPEYQGRGLGSELILHELAHAKALGKPLRLQVLRANDRARALYERLGFRLIGETENHLLMTSG